VLFRSIQAVQLAAIPDERERIAAEPARYGLDDRDRGGRRERRVDRVAALPQHPQPGLRGERMRRRYDVAREHRDAGRRIRVVPVEISHRSTSSKTNGMRPRARGIRHCIAIGVIAQIHL